MNPNCGKEMKTKAMVLLTTLYNLLVETDFIQLSVFERISILETIQSPLNLFDFNSKRHH